MRSSLSRAAFATLLFCCLLLASQEGYARRSADEVIPQRISRAADNSHEELGQRLPLWSMLPFVGILLSIALLPMVTPVFWNLHYPKVSFAWALIFAIPFLIAFGAEAGHEILHIVIADYSPFIILLFGVYTISGGIYLRGTLTGKPVSNLVFLIVGTVLASWMATPGAATLLIRPLIRNNQTRRYRAHTVVFFIFLVANIGGALTPLGDPPLFFGFLQGVPFFWTLKLIPEVLTATVILLLLYLVLELLLYKREKPFRQEASLSTEKLSVVGTHNILLFAVVVGAVMMSGFWHFGDFKLLGLELTYEDILRDLLILAAAIASLITTKKEHRQANGFTWFPIKEVAYLFFGIFVTIIAPLTILRAGGAGAAAFLINIVKTPAHFFWVSGSLSSFLDNVPTYLAFFNLTLGKLALAPEQVTPILKGILIHPQGPDFVKNLAAISCGSVFFGAMSYIGNAPNFMVRLIAEENNIRMPSFFGYLGWSVGILIPLFVIITLIFF